MGICHEVIDSLYQSSYFDKGSKFGTLDALLFLGFVLYGKFVKTIQIECICTTLRLLSVASGFGKSSRYIQCFMLSKVMGSTWFSNFNIIR